MSHDASPVLFDAWSDTTQNSEGIDLQMMFLGLDTSSLVGATQPGAPCPSALSTPNLLPALRSPHPCLFHWSPSKQTGDIPLSPSMYLTCCQSHPPPPPAPHSSVLLLVLRRCTCQEAQRLTQCREGVGGGSSTWGKQGRWAAGAAFQSAPCALL